MNLQQLIFTKNACYMTGTKITPKGIMVHSTGANNPTLKRYVGPDDGKLGKNQYNNHWNVYHSGGKDVGVHSWVNQNGDGLCDVCGGRQVCVHAFIGKLEDGSIATYQTLPWDTRAWHAGGDANNTHIGFEICEDSLTDADYFNKVYKEAIELCVYLCKQYNLTEKDIICHSEGYKRGIASNHSDVMHWFPRHGKSMDTFRAEVKALLNSTKEDSDKMYHIQLGSYKDKAEAEKALSILKEAFAEIAITTTETQPNPSPAPTTPTDKENGGKETVSPQISVGCRVKLKSGAKTYTGGGLASFVYEWTLDVSEIKGDRVVVNHNGSVIAAVNINDLILV